MTQFKSVGVGTVARWNAGGCGRDGGGWGRVAGYSGACGARAARSVRSQAVDGAAAAATTTTATTSSAWYGARVAVATRALVPAHGGIPNASAGRTATSRRDATTPIVNSSSNVSSSNVRAVLRSPAHNQAESELLHISAHSEFVPVERFGVLPGHVYAGRISPASAIVSRRGFLETALLSTSPPQRQDLIASSSRRGSRTSTQGWTSAPPT